MNSEDAKVMVTFDRKTLHKIVREQAQTMIDRERRRTYKHAAQIAEPRDPVLAGVLLELAKEIGA